MLSRKFKRFVVFFSSLYVVYFMITFHLAHFKHKAEQLEEEQEALAEQDVFLVNPFKPLNAQPKKFDTEPIPIPKYRHDEVRFVEDKDLLQHHHQDDDAAAAADGAADDGIAIQIDDTIVAVADNDNHASSGNTLHYLERFSFFEGLFDIYMNHFPQISHIEQSDRPQLTAVNINDDDIVLSEKYLSDHLKITDDQFKELALKHRSLLNTLDLIKPPKNLYRGSGVVLVSDTDENLLLNLLIVTVLRDVLKSDVPTEMVFVAENSPLCDELLPSMNVTCVAMLQNFNTNITKVWNFDDANLYKSLLIMNSNFANLLYLDPTTFPVEDPILNFKQTPFTKYGLVLWPDYWKRMTSPIYYKMIGKTIDMFRTRLSRNEFVKSQDQTGFYDKIPLHDRGGTVPDGSSLGQIVLIDKLKHFKTLILSLYYNINGNSFYYPMLTNFASNLGGGEKDTLLTLLNCLDAKYYQVKKTCQVLGSWFNNRFNGVGMKHYNPIQDFRNLIVYRRTRGDFEEQLSSNRVLFISINNPNLNPANLMENFNSMKDNLDGSRFRLLGEDLTDVGYDLELIAFDTYRRYICDLKYEFSFVQDRKKLCKFINIQLTYLKSTNRDLKLV